MGVNSLPKTVTRQRRDCDLNPGPSTPQSGTLTTRLPSHPGPCGSRGNPAVFIITFGTVSFRAAPNVKQLMWLLTLRLLQTTSVSL